MGFDGMSATALPLASESGGAVRENILLRTILQPGV